MQIKHKRRGRASEIQDRHTVRPTDACITPLFIFVPISQLRNSVFTTLQFHLEMHSLCRIGTLKSPVPFNIKY